MAPNDFNQQIIDEFRGHGGDVGGPFQGVPILLLHHTGRTSGEVRVNPLAYQKLEHGWAIFGSKGGSPTHPDWYLNLLAHPDTSIEVGPDTVAVKVREASGGEREKIWERQKSLVPGFKEYEQKAGSRVIPVLVLEPAETA